MQDWKPTDFQQEFGTIVDIKIISFVNGTITLDIETNKQLTYTFETHNDLAALAQYNTRSHDWADHNGKLVKLVTYRKPDWMWTLPCVML